MLGGDELTETAADDTPFHDDDHPYDSDEYDLPEIGDMGELIGDIAA